MTLLHVAGVALRGDGYPNATNTIRVLRADSQWQVEDHATWLPEGTHLWRVARGPLRKRIALALQLLAGNAWGLLRLSWTLRRRPGMVYVPYPAVFLLWWVSLLPKAWRPSIVADAYISMWDSAFRDRARGNRQGRGFAGRLAKALEGRALRSASFVLADTVANRDLMIAEFGLEASRVRAIPLAIGADSFINKPKHTTPAQTAPFRVLFVGTLIPLHGISVIADTVRRAGPSAGIEFHIVGDGQESASLESLMRSSDRAPLVWERVWLGIDGIAQRMAAADVCLGVFGGDGKSARVLPFKLYMALAAAKVIITQDRYSLPTGVPPLPVKTVSPEPAALLQALKDLQCDVDARRVFAREAAAYYRRWLGDDALRLAWQDLAELDASA